MMAFIPLILIILILLGLSAVFRSEELADKPKCDLHDWSWEEKVDKPGVHMIICKSCRLRPKLEEREE
jgi:hypothetical protein